MPCSRISQCCLFGVRLNKLLPKIPTVYVIARTGPMRCDIVNDSGGGEQKASYPSRDPQNVKSDPLNYNASAVYAAPKGLSRDVDYL